MVNSEHWLRYWYLKYNRLYFKGALPLDTHIWWEVTPNRYGECEEVDGSWVIRINPSLRGWKEQAKFVILHEMAHINLNPYLKHGRKFNTEMKRLALIGAFDGLW